MAAAAVLVADKGSDFTMDDLARRTHLSRATLYRRVGNKQSLLARLQQRRLAPLGASEDLATRALRAARVVLGQYGLAGVTMENIAAEAGVGVASLYRRFGTKDDLLRALIAKVSPRSHLTDLVLRPSGDLRADLVAIATVLLRFARTEGDLLRLMIGGSADDRALLSRLRQGNERSMQRLGAYLDRQIEAKGLRADVDASELALAFVGLVFGFALIGPRLYETEEPDEQLTAERVTDLFLAGAGSRGTGNSDVGS